MTKHLHRSLSRKKREKLAEGRNGFCELSTSTLAQGFRSPEQSEVPSLSLFKGGQLASACNLIPQLALDVRDIASVEEDDRAALTQAALKDSLLTVSLLYARSHAAKHKFLAVVYSVAIVLHALPEAQRAVVAAQLGSASQRRDSNIYIMIMRAALPAPLKRAERARFNKDVSACACALSWAARQGWTPKRLLKQAKKPGQGLCTWARSEAQARKDDLQAFKAGTNNGKVEGPDGSERRTSQMHSRDLSADDDQSQPLTVKDTQEHKTGSKRLPNGAPLHIQLARKAEPNLSGTPIVLVMVKSEKTGLWHILGLTTPRKLDKTVDWVRANHKRWSFFRNSDDHG